MAELKNFVREGKKIVGVGRNYRSLAAEIGKEVTASPLLFLKSTTSYVEEGESIVIPSKCSKLVYEVELGVVIGNGGKNIPESSAMSHIGGYVLALDMTAKDMHSEATKKGHPWSVSKSYDTFCPISSFIEKERVSPDDAKLWLKVDGELKQSENTKNMIFNVPYLINYISQIFTLERGDVILTGTPAGVGPVSPGQTITAGIEGVVEVTFPVVAQES